MLPPASYLHEQEKISSRWPQAVAFIREHGLNEFFADGTQDFGIIVQGGMLYNTLMRALELLGLADAFGDSRVPIYVMNVTYPVDDEVIKAFCAGKRAVLMVEEGQPDFIEQNLESILRKADLADPGARQGHAADGRRVHRRRRAQGPGALRDALRPRAAGRPSAAVRRARGHGSGAGGGRALDRRSAAHLPDQGGRHRGDAAPAGLLHRLPRAADLRGDEAASSASWARTT